MHMSRVQRKNDGLGYFNLLRGLGLLFIVVGHSIAPFLINQTPTITGPVFSGAGRVLGGGILALFFVISGMGFYRRSPGKCLAIQTKLLLKPYALTGISLIAAKIVVNYFKGKPFLQMGFGQFLTFLFGLNASQGRKLFRFPISTISILWFIVALFGGWVLFNCILHLPEKKHQYLCVLGCMLLSWVLSLISKVWPFALPMVLLAVVYIFVGYEIRRRHLLYRKLSVFSWCVLGFAAMISLTFGYVDIAACVWKLGPIDILGTVAVAFGLLRMYARFMRRGIQNRLVDKLEHLGMNSIRILCLHAFEHALLPWRNLTSLLPNTPVLCAVICLLGKGIVIWLLYQLLFHLPHKKKTPVTIELQEGTTT